MDKRKRMTVRQTAVYEGIVYYQRLHGYAPSIRELCKISGLASTSSVYAHLKSLEEMGYIKRKEDSPRAIAII